MAQPRSGASTPVKTNDFAPHSHPTPQSTLNHLPRNVSDPVNHRFTDSPTDTDSTATDSSDEFDWDAEDNASTNVKLEETRKAKRGRRLYLLFLRLARPIRIFLIGLIGSAILCIPLLLFLLVFKKSPARKHVLAWSFWASVTWAAGCLTSLLVDGIPRFVLTVIWAATGRVSETAKTQMELLMAVSFWFKLTLDVTWAWVVLSLIRSIGKPPGNYWIYVNRAMEALFSATILLLVEKLFLQFVAIRFHKKALADRMAENKAGLHALDKLSIGLASIKTSSGPRKWRSPRPSRPGSSDALASLGMTPINTRVAQQPQTPAQSPPHSRAGTPIQSEGEHHFQGIQGNRRKRFRAKDIAVSVADVISQLALKDSKFNKETEIGSLHSARRLARELFIRLHLSQTSHGAPARSHLIVDDFLPYFKNKEEAEAAFVLFDKDNNGDLTKKEMREAVQRIYRERKALIASLKDITSAVAKLDGVLLFVVLVATIFVCLLIFNRENTLASLVPMATIILGFSFIFGNSAQKLFESLIFIFSTHPFDVSDLVIIDDQPLFVKEFGLFATTFRKVDGREIIAPNALLAGSKIIHNVRRSNSMWETTTLMISYDTPLEVVEKLKARLRAYMATNNREWASPGVEVYIDKMDFQNAIHLTIAIEHRANWQNWGGRWTRRTAFMRHLKIVLEDLEIGYALPPQPVSWHPLSIPPPWATGVDNNSIGGPNGGYSGHGVGHSGIPRAQTMPHHTPHITFTTPQR